MIENVKIPPSFLADVLPGWPADLAEGRRRPELRLHVQAADHRKLLRGQDQLPLPLRRRLLHLRLCLHCGDRLQGQDGLQTG